MIRGNIQEKRANKNFAYNKYTWENFQKMFTDGRFLKIIIKIIRTRTGIFS